MPSFSTICGLPVAFTVHWSTAVEFASAIDIRDLGSDAEKKQLDERIGDTFVPLNVTRAAFRTQA